MVQVVAALINDGKRFMICQRPKNKARGLLWEFPGGKLEPGETPEQALVRECREELGVNIIPGKVYMSVVHSYPDIEICLTLFLAVVEGVPVLLEHKDIKWITPEQIDLFEFCPADKDILAKLKEEGIKG